ncbi:serine/threonine-protein kinase Nek4-like isoform X2 [Mya arenaria]|uniref:serine/threonine-protein kinase Nek4-like isoform X2 n=1 Tax=Mya arenaria TaxID=6604 RepID=UPI0022E5302C|nr:serine/threonine-protein kinase Nek4-like isoform X2 [Mya arenaria]
MAQAVLALEQFEYIRNIGKGSYGEVTLARHKRDRKQYVLKKINLKKASSRERRSAEQEAKLLSKLKHPNIVSYKDSFEKDGLLYIAMQFCEGGDLYNKLKEQRGTLLDERQLVEWFVQIAMALQYMHERNILHRDLKTQNIFLTKSKIIKVGDLGIARVLDNSSDMATTLIGTPYYMSPELFSNKPYNHKSDVWALGCCVYEMMTLKHAFNAKDMNSLVYKILRGKMPPMPRQYGKDLVDLVRNMLHQDPSKRPTVNRILRDPYIKKNIAIFLEETKQSRRPASGRPSSRPQSAKSTASQSEPDTARSRVSIMSNDSESSYDTPDSVRSAVESDRSVVSASQVDMAAGGEPDRHQHRMPSNLEPIIEGQVAGTKDESDQDTIKQSTVKANKPKPEHKDSNEHKENIEHKDSKEPKSKSDKTSAASKSEKQYTPRSTPRTPRSSRQPKPVDNPRPLPLPPKQDSEGLPQRRNNYNEMAGGDSKSSSSSGSKDDASLGDETPRSLPNMSAREKRRQRDNAQSYDRPQSARIVLVPPESSKSTVITDRDRKRYEQQAGPVRHRQPSIANDSSSSDEDTLKESDAQRQRSKIQQRQHPSLTNGDSSTAKHKKHHQSRENRDMDQFISVLDNTLQLNNQDDEEELTEVKVPQDETPRIPKSSSMPSVDTLCNADRLMARINLLHQDCIKGVGWPILKNAYEILGRIEEDEVEPKLVSLMGKEKFDLYAGKIWQLKFCEDMARIGIPS